MIAYAASAISAVLGVGLLTWILYLAWSRLLHLVEISERRNLHAVSPDPCRFCGHVGYHHEGCSRLDRFDRGMRG